MGGAVDHHRAQGQGGSVGRVPGRDVAGGVGAHDLQSLLGDGGAEQGVDAPLSARGITVRHVREELVWIDCEMTGLDLGSDKLIEIAALVTDADLNVLGDRSTW